MTKPADDRIAIIFAKALERPEASRGSFIDDACSGDQSLAARVRRLVQSHDRASSLLPEPGALNLSSVAASALKDFDSGRDDEALASHLIGRTIDGFRITSLLGAGGMGAVFEAQQENPPRTVALKLLRSGVVSRSLLRRFAFEAEALGRLRHPGIAQIYQTGTFDDGTGGAPYFAMEFVPGARSIFDHAEEHRLDPRTRLELFAQACDAVHHGHQRGVIHRDLKPANVLVDAEGQVKIIDYGVARTTDGDHTSSMHTRAGDLVGTIRYMSPEQVDGDPDELDTRTDVYSLGVILFELLTGRWPYESRSHTFAEAARQIQEAAPARIGTLRREFRGDIQVILDVALAKDPKRRYPSAAELASDIRRHLRCEPIAAAPPTLRYRAGLFVRRNPVLVSALAIVALTMVVGASVATWGWREAVAANDRTSLESERRQRALDFVVDLLRTPAPGEIGANVRVVEALGEAEAKISRSFQEDPSLELSIRAVLGEVLLGLGLYDEAESHYRRAGDLAVVLHGPQSVEAAAALGGLGSVLIQVDRPDEARGVLLEALDIRGRAGAPVDDDHALLLCQLATVHDMEGQIDEAESLYVEARGISAPNGAAQVQIQAGLGVVAFRRGDLEEAIAACERGYALAIELHGPAHPDTITLIGNLAYFRGQQGDRDGEQEVYQRAIATVRDQLGEHHPMLAQLLVNLGDAQHGAGQSDEARASYGQAIDIRRRQFGDDHIQIAEVRYKIAYVLQNHDLSQAAAVLRQVVEPYRRHYGDDSWEHLLLLLNLARTLGNLNEHQEAETLFQRCYEGMRRTNQAADQHYFLGDYVDSRFRNRKFDGETEELCRELARLRRASAGDTPPAPTHHVFIVLMRQARFDEAIAEADAAIATPDSIRVGDLSWRINRGMALLDAGRVADAAREAKTLRDLTIEDPLMRSRALSFRGSVRLSEGDAAEAEPLLRAALETRSPSHWSFVVPSWGRIETDLGQALMDLGPTDEATTLLIDGHAHLAATWGEDDWLTRIAQRRIGRAAAGD